MDVFPKTPEIIGIGFVAVVAIWILAKMINRVVDVIEKNADTSSTLTENIKNNTEATKSVTSAISGMQDQIKKQGEFLEILTKSLLDRKQ
jgi:uncharacterized oligopeptide transporter (OPT) family protein